jgi:hypothetical protein
MRSPMESKKKNYHVANTEPITDPKSNSRALAKINFNGLNIKQVEHFP